MVFIIYKLFLFSIPLEALLGKVVILFPPMCFSALTYGWPTFLYWNVLAFLVKSLLTLFDIFLDLVYCNIDSSSPRTWYVSALASPLLSFIQYIFLHSGLSEVIHAVSTSFWFYFFNLLLRLTIHLFGWTTILHIFLASFLDS